MGATCGAIGQGRWWLLSSHIFEAREKKTIGKFSRLGKAVDALADKKIDLTISTLKDKQWNNAAVPYYEGMVKIEGSHGGVGFLELTGY